MRIVIRGKLKRWILRFKIAWRILTKEQHIVALYLSKEQFIEHIQGLPLQNCDISFAGMMKHHAGELIKKVAPLINDVDIICAKGEFEATVMEKLQQKKQQ